jgi:hypothetical protein
VAALQDEHSEGNVVGLNLSTGEAMDPTQEGVYDSFRVIRNSIASSTGIASNLLLCDEMLKARQMVRTTTFATVIYANRCVRDVHLDQEVTINDEAEVNSVKTSCEASLLEAIHLTRLVF